MPIPATPSRRSGAASRALDAVVERLHTEFPQVTGNFIYEHVGRAHATAQTYLPDLDAYSEAVHTQARALIAADATPP
jgi:hypothetical protein